MRNYFMIIALIILFISQRSFAESSTALTSKQCDPISKACLKAGFLETGGPGKAFWYDCMKPILLGDSVSGVTVNSKDVQACRQFKIMDLKKLLKQLEQPLTQHT